MENKIEEIAKKFEFVLNMCDKFPDDMDLRHVVKTLKNDVTEILKEQPANPSPSSLPTDEEKGVTVKLFNNGQWKSGAEIYINGHWVKEIAGTFDEKHTLEALAINEDFLELVKNPPKHTLRTNFSSEKCEGENEDILDFVLKNFVIKYDEGADRYVNIHDRKIYSKTQVHEIFKQGKQQMNPPKQEQQTTK